MKELNSTVLKAVWVARCLLLLLPIIGTGAVANVVPVVPELCSDLNPHSNDPNSEDLEKCAERFDVSHPFQANQSLANMNAHYAYARGATGKGVWLGIVEGAGSWPGGLADDSLNEFKFIYGKSPTLIRGSLDTLLLPEALEDIEALSQLKGDYAFFSSHTNLSTFSAVGNNINTRNVGHGVAPEASLVLFSTPNRLSRFNLLPEGLADTPVFALYYGTLSSYYLVHGSSRAIISRELGPEAERDVDYHPMNESFWESPGPGIGFLPYNAQYHRGPPPPIFSSRKMTQDALQAAANLCQCHSSQESYRAEKAHRRVILVAAANNGNLPDAKFNVVHRLYRNAEGEAQLPLLFSHPNQEALKSAAEKIGLLPRSSSDQTAKREFDKIEKELQEVMIASVAMQDDGRIASYSNLCGAAADWCIATPVNAVAPLSAWFFPPSPEATKSAQDRATINKEGLSQFENRASGTSASTPYTLGAVGLVRSYFPMLSAVEVANRLKATAYLGEKLFLPDKLPADCTEIAPLAVLAGLITRREDCDEGDEAQMRQLRLRLTFGRGRLDLKKATEPMGAMMMMGTGSETGGASPLADSYLSTSATAFGDSLAAALRTQNFVALDSLQTPFRYRADALLRSRTPSRFAHSQVLVTASNRNSPVVMRNRRSLHSPNRATFSFGLSDRFFLSLAHSASPALLSGSAEATAAEGLLLQPDSAFASPWSEPDSQWRGAAIGLQPHPSHRFRLHLASEIAGQPVAPVTQNHPGAEQKIGQVNILDWQIRHNRSHLGAQWVERSGKDRLFGLSAVGGLGHLYGTETRAFNLWGQHGLGRNTDLLWSFWHASGRAALTAGTLREVDALQADSWSVALTTASAIRARSRWIWRLEQPMRLYDGSIRLSLPVRRTLYREFVFSSVQLRPVPSGREIRAQFDWQVLLGKQGADLLQFSLGRAHQPGHVLHAPDEWYAALTLSLRLQ